MNKYSLLIDVCTNDCAFIIFNSNFYDQIIYHTNKDLVDVMNNLLNDLMRKNNITYNNIENIYVIYGPGSFTGVRAGINMAKTIISVLPNIKLYTIDSLLAMNIGNGISLVDAKGKKTYIQISKNKKIILPTKMINNDEISSYISKYPDLEIFDEENLNIEKKLKKLIKNLDLFEYQENWIDVEPNYIKGAV